MKPEKNPLPSVAFGGLVLIALLGALPGCSTEQMAATGQAWQENQCNRLPDRDEQRRCLERARGAADTPRPSADPKAPR